MQENESIIRPIEGTDNVWDEKSIEKDIASLAAELDQIEDTFTAELTILKDKIGLEYSGYAQLAMNIGTAMHNISVMSGNNRAANKIAYVAAAATLVIQGVGAYKKNKAHNEYLDKLLEVKQSIAEGRILAMQTALPNLQRSLLRSEKMLSRFSGIEIPQEIILDSDNLRFKVDQGLRILDIYKTASFFSKLGNYIQSEAEAWSRGEHTAKTKLPGYSDVYDELNEKMFVPYGLTMNEEFINLVNESKNVIFGRDLLLASDPQGVAYIMHNTDFAYIEPEQTPIGQLLTNNPMIEKYNESVGEVALAIARKDADPSYMMKEAWIWSAVGLVPAFFLPTATIIKIIAYIIYLLVIWIIRVDFNHRLRLLFFYGVGSILNDRVNMVKGEAGYVEQPKRDFRKRKMFEGIFD